WASHLKKPRTATWSTRRSESARRLTAGSASLEQLFGDLDRVECGTLAEVVTRKEQRQAVGRGRILADATHVGDVLTGCFERVRNIVENHPRGGAQQFTCP